MSTSEQLRDWACGLLPFEAAADLIITGVNGRLLDGPWIRHDGYHAWFDADIAAAECGSLSGGERRVLEIATSLVSSDHPVDLGDALTGLDRTNLDLVLAALAHAGGR